MKPEEIQGYLDGGQKDAPKEDKKIIIWVRDGSVEIYFDPRLATYEIYGLYTVFGKVVTNLVVQQGITDASEQNDVGESD